MFRLASRHHSVDCHLLDCDLETLGNHVVRKHFVGGMSGVAQQCCDALLCRRNDRQINGQAMVMQVALDLIETDLDDDARWRLCFWHPAT
jgi:hypothetical protein